VAFPSFEKVEGVLSSCFFLLPNNDPRNPFSSFFSDFLVLSLSLFLENRPPFFSLLTFNLSVDGLVLSSFKGGGAALLDGFACTASGCGGAGG
jgi:hypothetical protein